jgi:acetyl esterase/lipase
LAAACSAAPAETAGSPTTNPTTGAPGATGTAPDEGAATTTDGTERGRGTGGAAETTVAPRPGRYEDEVFPEIEQVYDDAVFKTAADAPGFGGKPARDLLIDVWVPKGDDLQARPLMIFQFGGGFRFGDRNQLAGLAQSAAHRGFVTAAFDYRTGTGWQDPGLLTGVREDADDAVTWLTERAGELGFDPDAIISTGASAGAVNSIHMITMEPDQDDVVLAGIVSLSGANLTGQAPVAGGPPIIMFSGSQDTIVPFKLQTRFCEQYVAAGNVCEQHVYDAGHMGGDQADIKERSIAFVREQILRPIGY